MKAMQLAGAALAAVLSAAPAAMACTESIGADPVTGETTISGSPDWLRRQQAEWRAQADLALIAQIREARMVASGEIEFLIVPITTLDGDSPPAGATLLYRWHPGNTCNRFQLNLRDLVVVYADADESLGWRVVGLTVPDQIQDAPPDFRRRLRNVYRGVVAGPPLPE